MVTSETESVAAGAAPSTPARGARVPGIDALRFVLALWVALSHTGQLPYVNLLPRGAVRGLFDSLFDGPAAVTVFFVISGFCIHYPYRRQRRIELLPFYARRHVRILVPVVASMLFAMAVHVSVVALGRDVYWSLVCEEIYYTLYPLFLVLRARFGWSRMNAAAFAGAYLLAVFVPNGGGYHDFGFQATWIMGLPCWFLGCTLAENIDGKVDSSTTQRIWMFRLAVWAISSALLVLRFHTPLTFPYTLNLFGVLAYLWLREEVSYARQHGGSPLDRWGSFSYSLYLVHIQAFALWTVLSFLPTRYLLLNWISEMMFAIAVAWGFFALVERPSHHLARRVYAFVMSRRAAPAPA